MSWAYLVAGIVVAAIFVSLFIGLLCFRQIRDALFGTAANRRLREHQTPAGGPLAGHLFRDPEYFWAPAASLFGFLGEPRVDVLKLNLALDAARLSLDESLAVSPH